MPNDSLDVIAPPSRRRPRVRFGSRLAFRFVVVSQSAVYLLSLAFRLVRHADKVLGLLVVVAMPVVNDHPEAYEDDGTTCGSSSCGDSHLDIDFSLCDHLACRMCGCGPADDNPLDGLLVNAASRGKIPWAKYRTKKNAGGKPVCRMPTGRACAICRNVFNVLGMDDEHESLAKYYKFACKAENANEFRAFIAFRVEWIKTHNEGVHDVDSQVRLKCAKDMQQCFTSLTTTKSDKLKFEAPEWDFVSNDAWNTALDGELDDKKLTTAEIMGVVREGIWILRGRKGVFRARHIESTGTRRATVEDDGTGPFAKERLQNKLNVIRSGQAQFEKERAQKCVEKPTVADTQSMLELLQNIGALKQDNDGDSSVASARNAVKSETKSASSDDESDGDTCTKKASQPSRLASLFSTIKPCAGNSGASSAAPAAAKAKAVPTAAAAVAKAPARAGRAVASALGASPQGQNQVATTAVFDGRTRRIYESYE